jgi:ribonuclease E
VAEEAPAKPKRTRRKKADAVAADAAPAASVTAEAPAADEAPAVAETPSGDDDGSSPRRGWWQRTFGA